jgi:hypothetical protein
MCAGLAQGMEVVSCRNSGTKNEQPGGRPKRPCAQNIILHFFDNAQAMLNHFIYSRLTIFAKCFCLPISHNGVDA